MMLTKQQEVLTRILDCGICDLDLLEDIQYDLDDIIDELIEADCLSLNNIFKTVFEMGAMELQEVLNENNALDKIAEKMNQTIKDLMHDGMSKEEIQNDNEINELFDDYELLCNMEIDIQGELTYYLNYQDTHVALENADLYRKYFPDEIAAIEEKMGWKFKNGRC